MLLKLTLVVSIESRQRFDRGKFGNGECSVEAQQHSYLSSSNCVHMMQQLSTILPPPALPDGTVPTRSPEKQANLVRFQSELEVSWT